MHLQEICVFWIHMFSVQLHRDNTMEDKIKHETWQAQEGGVNTIQAEVLWGQRLQVSWFHKISKSLALHLR